MKKEFRIKKAKEIERILDNKKSISNEYFRLFLFKNPETSHFRYAISVGKKIGNAVCRNKVKRRLRMLFLSYSKNNPANFDYFLIAKPKIQEIKFGDLEKLFFKSMKRLVKQGENQ